MLQSNQSSPAQKFSNTPTTPYTPVKTSAATMEQATIGRSLVIKGEVSGSESLYIDGTIEGTINFADNRVTIGRNGHVAANITAKELVIMGTVKGNVECTDRLDIRSEGSLTGDVVTERISVEDGAIMKGSVEVKTSGQQKKKPVANEEQKTMAAAAGSN
jgi:cytoskeletal protein CcmA (bactofilin family)